MRTVAARAGEAEGAGSETGAGAGAAGSMMTSLRAPLTSGLSVATIFMMEAMSTLFVSAIDILARAAHLRAQRGDHIHDGGDVDVVRFGHMKTLPSIRLGITSYPTVGTHHAIPMRRHRGDHAPPGHPHPSARQADLEDQRQTIGGRARATGGKTAARASHAFMMEAMSTLFVSAI